MANGQRQLMAGAVALVFVHQGDLNVPKVGLLAQVILAHQAVKADGRGAASVDLSGHHLVYGIELSGHGQQHGIGALKAGALWHVQHQLELGFIVKGQHF